MATIRSDIVITCVVSLYTTAQTYPRSLFSALALRKARHFSCSPSPTYPTSSCLSVARRSWVCGTLSACFWLFCQAHAAPACWQPRVPGCLAAVCRHDRWRRCEQSSGVRRRPAANNWDYCRVPMMLMVWRHDERRRFPRRCQHYPLTVSCRSCKTVPSEIEANFSAHSLARTITSTYHT